MEETILKIGLAGLLHDIGKFAQDCIEMTQQYAINNADQYQPYFDNRHTHIHALYTAAFIEQFSDILPRQMNEGGWGEGDSFINLAAGHHKPETPLQWIITQADRMSSGLDRDSFEEGEKIAFQDVKKTRLLPIFEQLDPENKKNYNNSKDFIYRYPLKPLTAESIFPICTQENLPRTNARTEYKKLFDIFIHQLRQLEHRETSISLWANHLDSLLHTTTANIPAARVGDVVHDVSLYDHSRTTAAFASALYVYHKTTNTLTENAIRDNSPEKFLMVTGDFYGIQNFIFSTGGQTGKFRSKLLRGRSFAVSLFTELAADLICRETGLTPLSVLFNAAGKFTILAPNTDDARNSIVKTKTILNDWLHEISYGESSIGIAITTCRPEEFYCGRYPGLHDRHMSSILSEKLQKLDMERYSGTVPGYLKSFDRDFGLCSLCGKRPAEKTASEDKLLSPTEKISSCSICRDHILLGTLTVKKDNILGISDVRDPEGQLHKPFFNTYQLLFHNRQTVDPDKTFLKLWQITPNPDGSLLTDITMRPLNGYVPIYDREDANMEKDDQVVAGSPKTFNHIAQGAAVTRENKTTGTEAIGVLKADVDNMGLLLGCGLPEQRLTLSRLATLSRQLDSFFTVYLPTMLKENTMFQDIYTVFAGGDDLFLIGPWNKMAPLVSFLGAKFEEYVCANPAVTFSAGISVHKPHVPVDKLAANAEEALEYSKNVAGKNSITMFGETVRRTEFIQLLRKREKMEDWLDLHYISKGMMYRFNHLVTLAGMEKTALKKSTVHMEDMEGLKWRSLFCYAVERNINSSLKGEKRKQAVEEITLMAKWMDQYGSGVRIPLWYLLYDRR